MMTYSMAAVSQAVHEKMDLPAAVVSNSIGEAANAMHQQVYRDGCIASKEVSIACSARCPHAAEMQVVWLTKLEPC